MMALALCALSWNKLSWATPSILSNSLSLREIQPLTAITLLTERLLTRDPEETITTTTAIPKMVKILAPSMASPLTKDPPEETTIPRTTTLKVKATNKDPEETTTRTTTPVAATTTTEEDLTKINLKKKTSEIHNRFCSQ